MEFSTEMARNVLNSEIVEAEEILRNPSKVDDILAQLRAMDEETPALGLRAFVWNVEKSY